MKETKVIQTTSLLQNEEIHVQQCFGWEILNTQIVDYAISKFHMQSIGNKVYNWNTKERTNYIVLTFQRDTEIPNLIDIKALENEYESNTNKSKEINKQIRKLKNNKIVLLIDLLVVIIFDFIELGYIFEYEYYHSISFSHYLPIIFLTLFLLAFLVVVKIRFSKINLQIDQLSNEYKTIYENNARILVKATSLL